MYFSQDRVRKTTGRECQATRTAGNLRNQQRPNAHAGMVINGDHLLDSRNSLQLALRFENFCIDPCWDQY